MEVLMHKINLPSSLIDAVLKVDESKLNSIISKCSSSFSVLSKYDDLIRLAVCIKYANDITKQKYIDLGISLDVFYDTMSDIAIWCDNNNNRGLRNFKWIANHLNCELFKIGRLQFQLYKCKNNTLKYDYLPFNYGDNLVYIHIPQGEKLEFSRCVESLQNSVAFFAKYFKDFEYKFYFCESWLLYQNNFEYMSPSSNILQFQSLFDVIYNCCNDSQAIERIFGKRQIFKKKYPENTSLQRNAKRYMLDGNKLGMGIGIIDKLDI